MKIQISILLCAILIFASILGCSRRHFPTSATDSLRVVAEVGAQVTPLLARNQLGSAVYLGQDLGYISVRHAIHDWNQPINIPGVCESRVNVIQKSMSDQDMNDWVRFKPSCSLPLAHPVLYDPLYRVREGDVVYILGFPVALQLANTQTSRYQYAMRVVLSHAIEQTVSYKLLRDKDLLLVDRGGEDDLHGMSGGGAYVWSRESKRFLLIGVLYGEIGTTLGKRYLVINRTPVQ